jgi:hypothetical protein
MRTIYMSFSGDFVSSFTGNVNLGNAAMSLVGSGASIVGNIATGVVSTGASMSLDAVWAVLSWIFSWIMSIVYFILNRVIRIGFDMFWMHIQMQLRDTINTTFLLGYVISFIFLHYPNTEHIAAILLLIIHVCFIGHTYYQVAMDSPIMVMPLKIYQWSGYLPMKSVFMSLGLLLMCSMGILGYMYYNLHKQFSAKGAMIDFGSNANKDTLMNIKQMLMANVMILWGYYYSAVMYKREFDEFLKRYRISRFFVLFCAIIASGALYEIYIVHGLHLSTSMISVPGKLYEAEKTYRKG